MSFSFVMVYFFGDSSSKQLPYSSLDPTGTTTQAVSEASKTVPTRRSENTLAGCLFMVKRGGVFIFILLSFCFGVVLLLCMGTFQLDARFYDIHPRMID